MSFGMTVDLEEYRPYLSEFDMDEAQKDELLRSLWQIMCAFAELGWPVNSIHFAVPELAQISSEPEEDEVNSLHLHIQHHLEAATAEPLEQEDS